MSFYKIRKSTYSDASEIARVHKEAYSSRHFMALMSRSLLTSYYQLFFVRGVDILVSYKKNETGAEQIVGFVVFGQGTPEIITLFKKKFYKEIARTGVMHPRIFLRKMVKRLRSLVFERDTHNPASNLLLSIAVVPASRGVGSELLQAMLVHARSQGAKTIGLYVNTDNFRATNSYFKSGFVIKSVMSGQFYMECSLI